MDCTVRGRLRFFLACMRSRRRSSAFIVISEHFKCGSFFTSLSRCDSYGKLLLLNHKQIGGNHALVGM